MSAATYAAPWGKTLTVVSVLMSLLCVGVSTWLLWSGRGSPWAALLPAGIIAGSALFTIRGYELTPGVLRIRRLLWTTRLSLAGLQSAAFEPEAMHGSIRTFGNGGLFSFSGYFRNRILGSYRCYATDLHRSVVLRFPAETVVVSPSAPQEFAGQAMLLRPPPVANDQARQPS